MNGHVEQWLDAYLDNELNKTQYSQVETHLSSCLQCQELLSQRRSLSGLLKQVPQAQGLKSMEDFAADVLVRLEDQPQAEPSWLAELRKWLFSSTALNLGWVAVPLVLLAASIFIRTVGAMSDLLVLLPGPHQVLMQQITQVLNSPMVAQPQLLSGTLGGLGWFDLLEWNWFSELLALGAISLLYLAWLAGWLTRARQQVVVQVH